jgi:trehalose-6-phosphatase
VEKPEPDTATVDPAEPELGLRDIDGTVTESVVWPELVRLVVVDKTLEILDEVVAV